MFQYLPKEFAAPKEKKPHGLINMDKVIFIEPEEGEADQGQEIKWYLTFHIGDGRKIKRRFQDEKERDAMFSALGNVPDQSDSDKS